MSDQARSCIVTFLLCLLAVFLPPVAVLIETGCSTALLLNVVLCFLGWIPGIIHAFIVIFTPHNPPHCTQNAGVCTHGGNGGAFVGSGAA